MKTIFPFLTITAVIVLIILEGCEVTKKKPQIVNLTSNHGPYYFLNMIRDELIVNLDNDQNSIASKRWQVAIDGALNAGRKIPILDTIITKQTALIVVDMQKGFLEPGAAIEVAAGRDIISNINEIASAIRNGKGKVIFFRYVVNSDSGLLNLFEGRSYLDKNRESPMFALRQGHQQFELYTDLNVEKSDLIMNKTRYSAVLGSRIVDTLKNYGIKNVIVTGVTTDVCAGNTAESLMQMDYHVVMVWDGTAALDRLEHELYSARIFGLYGDVMPTEEVLMRLR